MCRSVYVCSPRYTTAAKIWKRKINLAECSSTLGLITFTSDIKMQIHNANGLKMSLPSGRNHSVIAGCYTYSLELTLKLVMSKST